MKCPFHKVKSDLPPLTERIAALPIDERGYPVPFFVAWIEGKPDFRVIDPRKLEQCVRFDLCWVCGQKMGKHKAFPIGPMCCVNKTTSEPPSHLECAEWSVRGCPFLSRPNMVRREDEMTEANAQNVAGIQIKRNPGVIAIWSTQSYKIFPDGFNKILFRVGPLERISWWREGRQATREEILHSIETGIPILEQACRGDVEELEALREAINDAKKLLPKPSVMQRIKDALK